MKALIQRANRGRVTVLGRETGSIGAGLVILLGVMPEDDERMAEYLADRCAGLRIFISDCNKAPGGKPAEERFIDRGGSAARIHHHDHRISAEIMFQCGRIPDADLIN